MSTRIYLVVMSLGDKVERPPRLVRASNRAQAERHVAQSCITARVASQDDIIAHVAAGVETAGEQDEE